MTDEGGTSAGEPSTERTAPYFAHRKLTILGNSCSSKFVVPEGLAGDSLPNGSSGDRFERAEIERCGTEHKT
ncbi:hypothetical protein NEOLI_001469 [Neolecta irregularis DAH-3]|uniref:Uncharacterized protein n=1 Tax=Neolecta irregularis (strain DAH-3) TaxID=1198029 RepID=A0A1U7LUE0_NEOID|nr:hypothetical protein NEOLI_001469 [Neolecta irregularis DAH-3]|eukprot:OLL26290.1 hypothetical protein NEOLI_001469 [Neolecta irregularis DAH-3]